MTRNGGPQFGAYLILSDVGPSFPLPGNWGQKVTRNGGPQVGACLILSDVGPRTPTKIPQILRGEKRHININLFALVNVQMALGQTAGCPRVNWAKKFMCSPRNTGK